ncbi:MAG: hypothetical protein ACOC4C_00890 [Fibrobacterota bacterium]
MSVIQPLKALLMLITFYQAGICAYGEEYVRISPTHRSIVYTGRVYQKDSGEILFDWPAVQISARLKATWCKALIFGENDAFDVYLDDKQIKTIRLNGKDSSFVLFKDMPDTAHTLRIIKRFASWDSRVTFKGLLLNREAVLLEPEPRPKFRIELVGGSILSGFGNQSCCIDCESISDSSNSSLSYGAFLADTLNAEYAMIAVSGKGLIREWASPFQSTKMPFGAFYDRTVRSDPSLQWNFENWVPHLVILHLGGNDFSSRPHPTKHHFISVYRSFILRVQSHYSGCRIVCVSSAKQPLHTYVKETVDGLKADGMKNISFFSYPAIPFSQRGCAWHPNVDAHRHIADLLFQHLNETFPEILGTR